MKCLLSAIALAGLALAHPVGAQKSHVVATFEIDGATRTVDRNEVALHLATRYRNGPTGKDALDHLIEVALVRQAAKAAGLMPDRKEVDAQIHEMEVALAQAKKDLGSLLRAKRMSREEFSDHLALGLAQSRLAAKVLGIDPSAVRPKHIALWTKEQRNQVPVETDPKKLGPGVLAKVGDFAEVTNLDIGLTLFTKIDPPGLERAVHEIVFRHCIQAAAKREGIEITRADLERQFALDKHEFETSGRNQGLTYEQWLQAFGGSKEEQLTSRSNLTKLQHLMLLKRRYPAKRLDETIEKDREGVLRRHGARRSMSILFVRATETPNELVRRDFAAAEKYILGLRRSIVEDKRSFSLVAKTSSDDPETKVSGGKVGWQHAEYAGTRRGQKVPDEVLAVAFGQQIGSVSGPIRTKDGFYLVWVSGLENEPSLGQLRARLLEQMRDVYNKELFANAKIRLSIS